METENDFFLGKSEQRAFRSSDVYSTSSATTREGFGASTAGIPLTGAAAGAAGATAALRGSYSGVPSGTAAFNEKRSSQQQQSFFRRKPWVLALLAVVIIAALAGGIGGGVAGSKSSGSKADAHNGDSGSSGSQGPGAGNGGNGNTTSAPVVTPLARWDWTNKNQKAYGVNLGNWLLLERWLDEDNFTKQCNWCGDEWSWTQQQGGNAAAALKQHFDTWFVESDLDYLQSYGVNTVRVTVGFWALIPTTQNEPFVNAGQMDYVAQLLQWLHKRGMYAVISLHGLPGSQSGDQSTGQKKDWDVGGSSWFSAANQQRSDAAVLALADWVAQQGNYSTVVSAVLPVNEPKQTDGGGLNQGWQNQLVQFYERSYATLVQHGIVTAVHPGYYQGQDPSGWQSFMNNKDPHMIIWETHPYPGYFPTVYDDSQIMNNVCSLSQIQNAISVPIFFGEWSLLSGVTNNGWVQKYFNAQIRAYNQGAGSTIWNWKANNSTQAGNGGLALPDAQMALYDFKTLVNAGVIPKPDNPQNILATLQGQYQDACHYNGRRSLPAAGTEKRLARQVRAEA